jgi:hypothetical protein
MDLLTDATVVDDASSMKMGKNDCYRYFHFYLYLLTKIKRLCNIILHKLETWRYTMIRLHYFLLNHTGVLLLGRFFGFLLLLYSQLDHL